MRSTAFIDTCDAINTMGMSHLKVSFQRYMEEFPLWWSPRHFY